MGKLGPVLGEWGVGVGGGWWWRRLVSLESQHHSNAKQSVIGSKKRKSQLSVLRGVRERSLDYKLVGTVGDFRQ